MMMDNWTLRVENFGKIEEAEIEVSPFTVLIGDNNSGKSYLMTLIYGLFDLAGKGINGLFVDYATECYKKCENIVASMFDEIYPDAVLGKQEKALTHEEFSCFVTLLNQVIFENKDDLINRLFNKKMPIGNIYIDIPYMQSWKIGCEITTAFSKNKDKESFHFYIGKDSFKEMGTVIPKSILNADYSRAKVLREITMALASFAFSVICSNYGSSNLYLPASRTGFMLTYKSLFDSSIDTAFGSPSMSEQDKKKVTLTRPCIDFLQNLNGISSIDDTQERDTPYTDIIKLLEANIIDGRVSTNVLPSADIFYNPSGSEQTLPLYVSSGVVTEIAPLSLLLKNNYWSTIMMEEPEMCLHPQLQWQLSRALIQILEAGTNVFITTHSDTIVQHINNMIKLYTRPDREQLCEKYNYIQKDMLDCQKVRIYQFDVQNNHRTRITPLTCSEYGFDVPTFNNTLANMFTEAQEFERNNEVD